MRTQPAFQFIIHDGQTTPKRTGRILALFARYWKRHKQRRVYRFAAPDQVAGVAVVDRNGTAIWYQRYRNGQRPSVALAGDILELVWWPKTWQDVLPWNATVKPILRNKVHVPGSKP